MTMKKRMCILIVFLCFAVCELLFSSFCFRTFAFYEQVPYLQFKTVSYDTVSLKCNNLEYADELYIYITNSDTNKTRKSKNVQGKKKFTIKGLEPATDYIFRLKKVSNGESEIVSSVKVHTPFKWDYKIIDNHYGTWNTVKNCVVTRSCDNGKNVEAFDISDFLVKFKKKIKYPYNNNKYRLRLFQNDNYVYFEIEHFYNSSDAKFYLWRMDNDGENLIYIGQSEYQNCSFIKDKVYCVINGNIKSIGGDEFGSTNLNYYADNYKSLEDEYIKDILDDLDSKIIFDLNNDNDDNYFREQKRVFSGPVSDGKYIYFTSEPLYNINEETDTIIYRSDLYGNDIKEIRRIKYDTSITYGDPNNGSVVLIGCDGRNCYYYVRGEYENWTYKCIFYSVSIKDTGSSPEKISEVIIDEYNIINLDENSIYITTYENFQKKSASMVTYEDEYVYYRIDLHSHEITKSSKPFEWYY